MDWTCVSETYQHGLFILLSSIVQNQTFLSIRGQVSLKAAATLLSTFKDLCRGFYLPLLITDLSGLCQDL